MIARRCGFWGHAFLFVILATLFEAAPAAPPRKTPSSAQAEGYLVGYELRPDVQAFVADMVKKHGFDHDELQRVFAHASYNDTVRGLMTPSALARVVPFSEYRARFVEPSRIEAGVRFWQTHASELVRAEETYGVPAEIIVGILGVETIYGRNTGNFKVLDALTTLAFDYPNKDHDRSPFFRSQLEDFLILARENDLDVASVRGSYAGAIGMPQFMPESILRYAVDFDLDGTIDLSNSAADAIGSVANFLASQGWQRAAPILLALELGAGVHDENAIKSLVDAGVTPHLTASDLRDAGLTVPESLGDDELVDLVNLPDGDNPVLYFAGWQNFYVLTRYNRSYAYAVSVVLLGDAIRARLDQNLP